MSFLKSEARDIVDRYVIGEKTIAEHYLHSPGHSFLTDKGWKFNSSPGDYTHPNTPSRILYLPSEKRHSVYHKGKKRPQYFKTAEESHESAMKAGAEYQRRMKA